MPPLTMNCSKPAAAYRTTRKLRLRKRQTVPCPACNFKRLIDAGDDTKTRTFQPEDPGYEDADYYQKCHHCGTEIGISKL